jgi:TolB-like protein
MRRFALIVALVVAASSMLWAGGSREAAGSSASGRYLAAQGIIVPPDKVIVDSYVASIDYHYPKPESGVGVNIYTGQKQVFSGGQDELIHIGIQGPETQFEDLAPMNLVFVIDHSGSMGDRDKLEWVKKAFAVFIKRVRDKDYVSLVVFNGGAEVLFPSTQMNSTQKRSRFMDVVSALMPNDGTDLLSGLRLGYQQAMTNFRTDYTNRVLFLTDGNDNQDHVRQMGELADSYRRMGINISTIGVGESFDLRLMNDLAARGGGSSRFISDMKEMNQMFGSDLDRMVVPAARDVRMTLDFEPGVEILGTWGYEHVITGQRINYFLSTLHHRDYETILAQVRIHPTPESGKKTLARFSLTWQDLQGGSHSMGPYPVEVEVVGGEAPVSGFSDATVLRSGTMLDFAQTLQKIGSTYYAGRSSPTNMKTCLDLSTNMRKELRNARLRLDDSGFDKEIGIMEQYIQILGKDLAMNDEETAKISRDDEIASPAPQRPLEENLANLFHEILLHMQTKPAGAIAVSGFTMKRDVQPQIITLLNERGLVELTKIERLHVVERDRLDAVMKEQKLSLSDLMDTENAITVGRVLSARFILTGSVIEMTGSVVIFARIVGVETAEVESAAQVIVPKSPEVVSLL